MKKISLSVLSILLLSLTACFGGGAASTVEKTYKAAMDQDTEFVGKVFSQAEDYDEDYLDDVVESLALQVKQAKSVKDLQVREVKQKQLNKEVVEDLTDMYDDNWTMVTAQIDKDYIMAWIMQKIDGKYYAVDGDIYEQKEFTEDVLK